MSTDSFLYSKRKTNKWIVLSLCLKKKKKIKSINSFCDQYQIDKRNLYAQREDLNRGYFEVFWISVLIQNYKVSAKYLLFGKGKMYSA